MAFFTGLWLFFEISQLVACERLLRDDANRRAGRPGSLIAFLWIAGLALYYAWMIAMLWHPAARAQIAAMLGVSLVCFFARRASPFRRVRAILRFEGAVRIGILLSLWGTV